jgi:DNA polymerase III epsilon subunit-like protein
MSNEEMFFSVDVEASGPIPGEYSMLSLGCCLVENQKEMFYCELKPITEQYVPEALEIGGFDLQMLKSSGREPSEAMEDFENWVKHIAANRRAVCVGFNVSFDWQFINYYLHRYLGSNVFGIGALDIKAYYMGFAKTSWDATRSSKIAEQYKPVDWAKNVHNALQDAIYQAEMFRRMRQAS